MLNVGYPIILGGSASGARCKATVIHGTSFPRQRGTGGNTGKWGTDSLNVAGDAGGAISAT